MQTVILNVIVNNDIHHAQRAKSLRKMNFFQIKTLKAFLKLLVKFYRNKQLNIKC